VAVLEEITMTTRTLYAVNVCTVAELKAAIDMAMVETRMGFGDQINSDDVITFGLNGGPLRLRLIEDILTDGSKVYDLNIE
jgi:hypothetical protein